MKLSKIIMLLLLNISAIAQQQKINRTTLMEGTSNFRELGGIITKDGRQVRKGIFFRSGVLTYLTPVDLEVFEKYDIRYIFDFRNNVEIEKEPDVYPNNRKIKRFHTPIGTFDKAQMDTFYKLFLDKKTKINTVDSIMIQANINFVKEIRDYKPLINAMMVGDVPMLFHCTAGKDRTGFAAALILSILNVDKEVIIQDYLISATNLTNENEMKAKAYEEKGVNPEIFKTIFSVKREYLEAAFNEIRKEYGTMDKMLQEIFNIDKAKQKELIAKYTN